MPSILLECRQARFLKSPVPFIAALAEAEACAAGSGGPRQTPPTRFLRAEPGGNSAALGITWNCGIGNVAVVIYKRNC